MGLFDFGDRTSIQTMAYRIGVCIEQMEGEIRKSPTVATPDLRGLADWAMVERKKMMHITSSLTQSSLESLKVEFKREKIAYNLFLQKTTLFSYKVKELTGIDFVNGTIYIDGADRKVR